MIGLSVIAVVLASLSLIAIILSMVTVVERQANPDAHAGRAGSEPDDALAVAQHDQESNISQLLAEAEVGDKLARVADRAAREREDYRHDTILALLAIDRTVDHLKWDARTAIGNVKRELDALLADIHAKRVALGLDAIATELDPDTAWTDKKARLDTELSDLTSMVERAVHRVPGFAVGAGAVGALQGLVMSSSNGEPGGLLSDDALVDEAGAESFPASDPPSWTCGIDRHWHRGGAGASAHHNTP